MSKEPSLEEKETGENVYGCVKHIQDASCSELWSRGYDAGFRGDQLIFEMDKCYMAGYEGGQTAKMLEAGDFSGTTSS